MKRPFFRGPHEAFSDWWNKNKKQLGPGGFFFVDSHDDVPAYDYKASEYDPAPYVSPEASILREAEDLITGERNGDYGDAVEDFSVTAEYWNTYMRSLGMRVFLTAQDVSLLLTLLKIRRQSTHPKRDNLVDAAGYIALAQKCEEEDND